MEKNASKPIPVLVTLTSPTAAGKSYLFNYIRDVAKLPCLIGTTTRSARVGEQDGVDYHFISEAESKEAEAQNRFVELVTYNGVRYGVTKDEFDKKMEKGLAFLIVEPNGIPRYTEIAKGYGARHLKIFIDTPMELRLRRFRGRATVDVLNSLEGSRFHSVTGNADTMVMKTVNTYLNRLTTILTEEVKWQGLHEWDRTLSGEDLPENNLKVVLADVKKIKLDHIEADRMLLNLNKSIDALLNEDRKV